MNVVRQFLCLLPLALMLYACSSSDCQQDTDCLQGQKCGPTKRCIRACTSNDDCTADHYCSAQGTCEPNTDGSTPESKVESPSTCKDGEKKLCYDGEDATRTKGLCQTGEKTCVKGVWGPCKGQVLPTNEVCDKQDNDCDGQVDENLTNCGCQSNSDCPPSKPACQAGACVKFCKTNKDCEQQDFCSPEKFCKTCANGGNRSAKEVCDGKDNDCNGKVDDEVTRNCGSNVGSCRFGTQTCKDGAWEKCIDDITPTAEICDGKDNDCNGKIDDNCTIKCKLIANPRELNFGYAAVNTTKKQTLTLTNQGSGECKITAALLVDSFPTANHGTIKLVKEVKNPTVIASKQSLAIEMQFTPNQQSNFESSIVFSSNDPQFSNYQVKIKGTTVPPCLSISDSRLDFGTVQKGCLSQEQTVSLTHSGHQGCGSVQISKLALSQKVGKGFQLGSKQPTLPATLNAGETLDLNLQFKSESPDIAHGRLTITTSANNQETLVVNLEGEGSSTGSQIDVYTQSTAKPDILFVIDDSCSMGEEQAHLAKNFKSFMSLAFSSNANYQIAVTTTDVSGRKAKAGCFFGQTKIITSNTPNVETAFATNMKPGVNGSAQEQAFEAAYQALSSKLLKDPACNKGFLRRGATLSLIFVSDEPEQSPQSHDFYLSFFNNIKKTYFLNDVVASAIVGPEPNGCKGSGGSASAAPRLIKLAKDLNGISGSICQDDWSSMLQDIGNKILKQPDTFFLSRIAEKTSIVVKVNGKTVPQSDTDGWKFDEKGNSITFSPSKVPPSGDSITIEYKATCNK